MPVTVNLCTSLWELIGNNQLLGGDLFEGRAFSLGAYSREGLSHWGAYSREGLSHWGFIRGKGFLIGGLIRGKGFLIGGLFEGRAFSLGGLIRGKGFLIGGFIRGKGFLIGGGLFEELQYSTSSTICKISFPNTFVESK